MRLTGLFCLVSPQHKRDKLRTHLVIFRQKESLFVVIIFSEHWLCWSVRKDSQSVMVVCCGWHSQTV